MTTQTSIRTSLASVRTELAETFPRLTDDILNWAPAEGMRTIKGQFVEILSTEHELVKVLRGLPKGTYDETEKQFKEIDTVAGLIAKTEEIRKVTLEFLHGLDEEGLNASAKISEGFASYLGFNPTPASEVLRFIIRHESYHSGQLVSYLWARGDDPYKWD